MKLSVLMSIYYKEDPSYFNQAMESIWDSQTIKPNEIILVEDGKLTEELYSVIEHWKTRLPHVLTIISLEENIGTGGAKQIGLEYCKGDFIAIMDTDDISNSERFEKQISFLEKNKDIDIVGCWISEINEYGLITREEVKYPLLHSDLYDFFKRRDPIPHMTSMFRKRCFTDKNIKYLSDLKMAEDTLIWYQAFLNDCKLANLNYVGVNFRATSFYKRRGNVEKSIGLLKFRLFHINRDLKYGLSGDLYAIAYFLMSLSPSFVKKILYKIFR